MTLIDEVAPLGVNIEDAVQRFMGNAALFERMLKKYPETVEKSQVKCFFEIDDFETALNNAHTLKGVAGNLSIDPLYEGYSGIVSLLREGKNDEARELLEKTLEIERPIIECIRKYCV